MPVASFATARELLYWVAPAVCSCSFAVALTPPGTVRATPPRPMYRMHRDIEELRSGNQSPRPETPEPDSRQGRRNPPEAGVQLLDDDGAVSVQVGGGDHLARQRVGLTLGGDAARVVLEAYLCEVLYAEAVPYTEEGRAPRATRGGVPRS